MKQYHHKNVQARALMELTNSRFVTKGIMTKLSNGRMSVKSKTTIDLDTRTGSEILGKQVSVVDLTNGYGVRDLCIVLNDQFPDSILRSGSTEVEEAAVSECVLYFADRSKRLFRSTSTDSSSKQMPRSKSISNSYAAELSRADTTEKLHTFFWKWTRSSLQTIVRSSDLHTESFANFLLTSSTGNAEII